MRTRRSPRNQDRLFAALFRPAAMPEPAKCPKCGVRFHARLDGKCRMADLIHFADRAK